MREQDIGDLNRWIEWASDRIGLEAEAIETPISQFDILLSSAGPAVFQVNIGEEIKFLLLLGKLQLIAPDLRVQQCQLDGLRTVICEPYGATLKAEIDRLLLLADVPKQRWQQVRSVMIRERLGNERIRGCWMLPLPSTTSFWQQLSNAHLPKRAVLMIVAFVVVYGLEIAGWSLIGQAALNGRLDYGWFTAWAFLVLSLIPLHLLGGWLDANFALDLGRILKKQLLAGALRMDLQAVNTKARGSFWGG